MPNIWTHLIFGQEVLKRIGKESWLQSPESRNLFHLGCQGPDPMFYHRFWPWLKEKPGTRLANRMHEEQCGPFLVQMLRQLRGCPEHEPAFLYAAGFLLHHVLDRNAHPYIFVKSGFKPWNHYRFEVILDTITAAKLRGIETWKTPVWRELVLVNGLPAGIARMMDALASEFYPEEYAGLGPEDWRLAYQSMVQAQKLFHDPTGLKRILTAGKLEPYVYRRRNAPLDYTNEARRVWYDPTDREAAYETGFWDHWEAALREGERLLEQAVRTVVTVDPHPSPGWFLMAEQEERMLAALIGNVSYSTGRECGRYEIKYVDPII